MNSRAKSTRGLTRRDFVTGLLSASVAAPVLAKTDALTTKVVHSAPKVTHLDHSSGPQETDHRADAARYYGASMYERNYVRMHQEALSRQLARQLDDQIMRGLQNGRL